MSDSHANQKSAEQPTQSSHDWRRLHPSSLVFNAMSRLWAVLLPLAYFVFFRPGSTWQIWLGIFVIIGLALECWAYFRTYYCFAERDLIVRRDLLFFRNERHIPFARIQNIDLTQNPLHRLVKVAIVRIETAGGSESEANLKLLSLEAVEQMRDRVFRDRSQADVATDETIGPDNTAAYPGGAQPGRELLTLSTGELVRLGLTSVRGFALVAALLALLWQFDVFDLIIERFDEIAEAVMETWRSYNGADTFGIWMYIALGLVALSIFMLLSILWAVLKFYGFHLMRRGEDLRFACGLLTRRTATVPRNRIQLICVRASFVHRWMGRVTIRVETASGAGDDNDENAHFNQKWIAPMVREDAVESLLRELHDDATIEHVDWMPLAAGAAARLFKRKLVQIALLCAGLAFLFHWWTLLAAAVLVPLALWHSIAAARRMAYAHTPWGVMFRSGVFIHSISMTMFNKMQVLTERTTPFDRMHRMARLFVDTAGAGPAEHRIAIPYLPAGDVERLRMELTATAEQHVWRI